ncbi:MAG: hypothetical protein ICV60_06510 [Pyrinomonadaceae bacterium]|nr:hypothetical protein [Pyrinomonadaceae bacterium]
MRKQVLLLLASALTLAGIITITSLHSRGQGASGSKAEVATPVQQGVMSAQQKEHSKLYKDYKGNGKLLNLLNKEENNADNELIITVMPGLPELSPKGRSSAPEAFLNNLASSADAVVIGTVTNKSSQLTENGAFVFTDYDVSVEEVLKDNGSNSLQSQSSIVVTRPGGRILLEGRVVTARDRAFKPFTVGGRYLLFLKYIPTTDAYHAVNDKGSFELVDNKSVKLLTEAPDAPRIDKDAPSFINDVRTAIAATKSRPQDG